RGRPKKKPANEGKATPAQNTKKELDPFQGGWTMVSLEQRGEKAPDEVVKGYKLTVQGDRWTVTTPEGEETTRTFRIDPSQDPKTMDMTTRTGDKETVSRGIYKLDGDTLTLCRTTGDLDRPKEFKTTAEAGILVVWKRAKK